MSRFSNAYNNWFSTKSTAVATEVQGSNGFFSSRQSKSFSDLRESGASLQLDFVGEMLERYLRDAGSHASVKKLGDRLYGLGWRRVYATMSHGKVVVKGPSGGNYQDAEDYISKMVGEDDMRKSAGSKFDASEGRHSTLSRISNSPVNDKHKSLTNLRSLRNY